MDEIAVVDTKTRRVIRRIEDRSPAGVGEGSTPNALAADESHLFVAEGDNNAVAMFDIKSYPPFDMKITDQRRAGLWIAELQEFVRSGDMPALEIVQLPRDHTAGGKAGLSTPRTCMADNDLALGRMIEALSKTPFWRDTLVVVVEDDAQDGADHVDSHRAPFLLISAYDEEAFNRVLWQMLKD